MTSLRRQDIGKTLALGLLTITTLELGSPSQVSAQVYLRRNSYGVLEATDSDAGFDHATRCARIGGRLVMVGIPNGNRYTIAASEARRRGLGVKFSRRMPEIYPRAIALAQSGRINMAPLASHSFKLEETARAFAMQAAREDGIIKAIIYP